MSCKNYNYRSSLSFSFFRKLCSLALSLCSFFKASTELALVLCSMSKSEHSSSSEFASF